MHRCISQRASKSMDRPSLPLFDGRFSHYQVLFDESNSSGKVSNLLSLPGGFRFSAFPWSESGASISHASLTSHVTVILYHAEGMP